MGRGVAWAVGTVTVFVLLAIPARAQVIVGAPGVYVVDRYDEAVNLPYDRYWRHERARERAKRYREYYKDLREARREYEKDRREAEREYLKDLREAQREYEKDRREAIRDRRWRW